MGQSSLYGETEVFCGVHLEIILSLLAGVSRMAVGEFNASHRIVVTVLCDMDELRSGEDFCWLVICKLMSAVYRKPRVKNILEFKF